MGGMELPGLGSMGAPAGTGAAPALAPGGLAHMAADAGWREGEHPRGGNAENKGQFSKAGGGGKAEAKAEKFSSFRQLATAMKNKQAGDFRAKIKAGEVNITVKRKDQDRHDRSTQAYKDYVQKCYGEDTASPSYFTRDVEAEILSRLGDDENKILYTHGSLDYPHEYIEFSDPIGRVPEHKKKGAKMVETKCVCVVYSKNGVHFYPVKEGP
jgi:hypothetical protein